jgi:hypothetical protein
VRWMWCDANHQVLTLNAHVQGSVEPQHLGLPANLCKRNRHADHGDIEYEEEAKYETQALRLELTDTVSLCSIHLCMHVGFIPKIWYI